ncbi:MAG: hypothetical protein EA396_01935 [Anaerolineaceae bacterium]|nr:MAG: hypothetical protein EA396_01935 [Anaerolineaceae bacterium]
MLDSSVIGVVIALIFVYSLMGILVTFINNLIASLFSLRSRMLREGLVELIVDEDMQRRVLSHPLIRIVDPKDPHKLTAQSNDEGDILRDLEEGQDKRISHIPPATFVQAIKSILISEAEKRLFDGIQQVFERIPNSEAKSLAREAFQQLRANFNEASFRELLKLVDGIPDENLAAQLRGALEDFDHLITQLRYNQGDLAVLMQGIEQIQNAHMRGSLKSLLITARNVEDAENRLMDWFDDGMARLTEAFSRQMARISVVVAIVLTLLFNVDTLHIANVLYQDDDLRQAVVMAALEFEAEADAPILLPEDATPDDIAESAASVQQTASELLSLGLPITWSWQAVTPEMAERHRALGMADPYRNSRNLWNFFNGPFDETLVLIIAKLMGLGVTVIAAAQGAPFWFSLLRRITNGR